ncbi:hypothetical protein AgCh_018255 [Apium graveolens]
MVKPKESIIDVFERFNKLINDLQLHEKYYEAEEVNLKFLITFPDHLEQKISAIREGKDLSRITMEVLYEILKMYELKMIQRKSLRSGQGHVVDGSSALIVNESQTSIDEPRSQTSVISPSEQRTKDSQEQVILELEEDEFYTLDELDELDHLMTYLARKFSNIRVKKPRYFKGKGQIFNKDSSWKGKGKYTSDSKNGYKTGSVDRSKIRCFNCDELGHFVRECRKPKKAKKDKAYLELEAKYEALLKKQQSKTYIAGGKSWDDSDIDEDEEVGNYALMALEQGESSSSKSQNKLKCASEIEAVLREKQEKNEVKLKSFKNASELIGQYHEKNKPCVNIDIGLDYDALNSKKKDICDKGKATENENVLAMLKKDKEKKNTETTPSSKAEEKLMDKQSSKTPEETKTEDARKKKKNRNGKIGINKSNNFAYVADAPRKKYEKFDSGKVKKVIWIIDSGCSRHMTGDKALLSQFEEKAGPLVTFGDNSKGFTMGYGKIVSEIVVIDDVALVASLEKGKMKRSSHNSKTVNSITARTAQQNGVVERKNRTLVEAARRMLQDAKLLTSFWEEVVNTACYTQNRYLINKAHGKSPYPIMSKRKPTVKHFQVFRSKYYILKDNSEYVGKFDSKVFEAIFLGYSLERTTYKVYVINQKKIMESTYVTFDDDKCPGLECLDENEAEAFAFENLNIDSDSDGEDEVNAQQMLNEEITEQQNHGNGSSSRTPEFDRTNSRGEIEE